jgi:hypothetical protein
MSKEAPSRLSKLSRFYEQSVGKPHIATAVTDHEPWDAEVESIVCNDAIWVNGHSRTTVLSLDNQLVYCVVVR